MHECTSIIINSFHLFQKTLFNKGFQGFPKWGRSVEGGGTPHPTIFFETPPSKPMPPMGHPSPLKNEAPLPTEKQAPTYYY